MDLEYKSIATKGIVEVDADQGIITTIVAVTGIEDNVKDIIEHGAFTKSMQVRTPKGVWSHDWKIPVSKTLEMKELPPGDPDLPSNLANGDPWPTTAGAVKVRTQFNLGTPEGSSAFSNVVFYDDEQEWSIGYNVPPGASYKDSKGVRHIKEMNWFEYSPVLFGAMTHARSVKELAHDQLVSVKSLLGDERFYEEVGQLTDEDFGAADANYEDGDALSIEVYDYDESDDDMSGKGIQNLLDSLESKGFENMMELKQAVGSLEIASRNGELALTNEFSEDVLDLIEEEIELDDTYTVDLVKLAQSVAELSSDAERAVFYDLEDEDDDEDDDDDDDDELYDDEDDEENPFEVEDADENPFEADDDEDDEDDFEDDEDEEKSYVRVGATEYKALLLNM